MTPVDFPGSNSVYGPPPGMREDHCNSIPARIFEMKGGPWDGSKQVMVAWRPDEQDLKRLNEGGFVYMVSMGGLSPHYLTTDIT